MNRRIILIVSVMLLSSSAAFGIHQRNDFAISAENIVESSGISGWQHDGKLLPITNSQITRDIGSRIIALQYERGIIGQRATVWGIGGASRVALMGLGIGYQDQIAGSNLLNYIGGPTALQQQGLGTGLAGILYKHGGSGGAMSMQYGLAHRLQTMLSPDSIGRQSQSVRQMLFSRVTGREDSDSSVTQNSQVHTEQFQTN